MSKNLPHLRWIEEFKKRCDERAIITEMKMGADGVKIDMAKKFLHEGMSCKFVAEATELTLGMVKKIAKEL